MSRMSDPKFRDALLYEVLMPALELAQPETCRCPVRSLRRITNYTNSNPLARTTDPAAAYLQADWPDIQARVEVLCDAIHIDHPRAVEEAWEVATLTAEAMARADQEGNRHAR